MKIKMHCLLIVYDNESYIHHFPLGLAYISATLKKAGHKVTVYNQDLHHSPDKHITELLDTYHFDIVAIGMVGGYYQYRKILSLSSAINASKNRNKFKYIIGGHLVSPAPLYFLRKTLCDAVIIGEGEIPVLEYIEALEGTRALKTVSRIGYRDNNKLFVNPEGSQIEDLSTLPLPDRDSFPMEYYRLIRLPNTNSKDLVGTMVTGRGCPHKCLSGNTVIDTFIGKFKIKDLVGKKDVKVFTRNLVTKELEYANAYNIFLIEKSAKIVRVYFSENDGQKSIIDCTPDHRFKILKGKREKEIEAKDLKSGQDLVSIGYLKYSSYKVLKVENLPYREDVYCMTVPGYNWFFANNILVHNCNFCFRNYKGYRLRTIESVIEEIKMMRSSYDINYIDFSDDLTMASKKRITELSEAIIKNKLNIKWRCEARLNYADLDVLKVMKRSGCVFANYGIEAIDDKVLYNMHKALTLDIIYKGIENTIKAGISPGLNIIWNGKKDTKKTLWKGVNFLLKYDDCSQLRTIRFVTPYPGTELYYDAIRMGKLKGIEDFYEVKHTNSDLLTVNFMDMSDEEAYKELSKANIVLLNNYYNKHRNASIKNTIKLYKEKDVLFRGFRQF